VGRGFIDDDEEEETDDGDDDDVTGEGKNTATPSFRSGTG
jgi:hypothetical protein